MNHYRALALSLLLGVAGVVVGCGSDSPIEAIKNKITCKDVCQRYADCFDGSYDVSGCTDRCTNSSTSSDEKDDKLAACNSCMNDKSCASAVFNCSDDCSSFVP